MEVLTLAAGMLVTVSDDSIKLHVATRFLWPDFSIHTEYTKLLLTPVILKLLKNTLCEGKKREKNKIKQQCMGLL